MFIEAPNGNQLLYDAGPPNGAVLRELSKIMPFYDRSIDVVILSHPDMDHIGGSIDVFRKYKVKTIITSGASSTNGSFDEVENYIQINTQEKIVAHRGLQVYLSNNVVGDVLYPTYDTARMDTNDSSIVLKITYGSTSFLFSGDLPKNIEEYLVSIDPQHLDADVLKLGHHGSRTSSGEKWLRSVSPHIAVISAGKENRYGHPHKEVLDTLDRLHIPYLGTYIKGTLLFKSNGKEVQFTQ